MCSDARVCGRFWSHVEITDGCWNWKAYKKPDGYGHFRVSASKVVRAHRWAYACEIGEPPAELDHTCRNKACVNPDHLEPVSHQDNIKRTIPFRKERSVPPARGRSGQFVRSTK